MRLKLVLLFALAIQAGCQSFPEGTPNPYYSWKVERHGSNR